MTKIDPVPPHFFFKGQTLHAALLVLLLVGVWFFIDLDQLGRRHLFGLRGNSWLAIAVAIPILHQVFVWLVWRTELCTGAITRHLGHPGFLIYFVLFQLFFWSRFLFLIFLVVCDRSSLDLPIWVRGIVILILGVPTIYAAYSVARYFGVVRASGADHFDEDYRSLPMVKEGIFRYTSNAMYTFAFLAFWIIAIAGASWAGLVVAAFSHAYIWVHYFCTERPDMQAIYNC